MTRDGPMSTRLVALQLARAFPPDAGDTALAAATAAESLLEPKQWTDHFSLAVDGALITVPHRIRFASEASPLDQNAPAWQLLRALQSRSFDGHQRQRAVADLLLSPHSWTAPFVLALIGDYVVEILQEIEAGMSPELLRLLRDLIAENPVYWRTTRQRVTSYWTVYYQRAYQKGDYVGFRLVEQLDPTDQFRSALSRAGV